MFASLLIRNLTSFFILCLHADHHFFDTEPPWASFLNSIAPGIQYFPENYTTAAVEPIQAAGVDFLGSVHIEALPEDGVKEIQWIQSMIDDGRYPTAKAIMGSCDLSASNAEDCLAALKDASPLVVGVRWLLIPPFFSRVNGTDLLKGGPNGTVYPPFEQGYALLADQGFKFDLQCFPEQLSSMFELASKYPDIPVMINHLGRPVVWPLDQDGPNQTVIAEWRANMNQMSTLPHVFVKISMLGHMVPNWIRDPAREAVVRELVLETIELFGPERCSVNLNWWLDASTSDNDGTGTVGPEPVEFLEKTFEWFASTTTAEEREWLYWKTGETFYLGTSPTMDSSSDDDTSNAAGSSAILNILVAAVVGVFVMNTL